MEVVKGAENVRVWVGYEGVGVGQGEREVGDGIKFADRAVAGLARWSGFN